MQNNADYEIIIVGAGEYEIYDKALCNAFREIGYINTSMFSWSEYYKNSNIIERLIRKIEVKITCGIKATKFNKDLLSRCKMSKPQLVFIYTCRLLYPLTVKRLSEMGIPIASYCNDNPFSRYYPWFYWRNYRDSLKYCDINYAYRVENIYDIERKCGRKGELLRSYYIDSKNHLCMEGDIIANTPDVIFLGHYEDDYRMEYLKALDDSGIEVGLPKKQFEKYSSEMNNVILLEDEMTKYNEYICSCKIPITFLSTLNHDTYTRRCFEIPAAGALLFCPYTEDLANLFTEDKEIVFYRNKSEFVSKIHYYLEHDDERKRIAQMGRERLINDGHEIKDRARKIINDVARL